MQLAGKRAVVMGLGRFGGGVGAARFLAQRGANVLVTDSATGEPLSDSLAAIADLPVETHLGGHDMTDFTSADLLVVNPAVRPDSPFIDAARKAGAVITSEIALLVSHLPDRTRVIGVTGTAGKSTVTAMIGHILQGARGKQCVHVGGNLGGSLLNDLDKISADHWVVLELSSFMLESLAADRWSPHVAVVTNLWPNHLDRHGSIENYAAAKQTILEYQQPSDVAILGSPTDRLTPRTGRIVRVNDEQAPALPLLLPGVHNQVNAQLAIAAASCAGVDGAIAAHALSDFRGLPHRLQFVGEHAKARYFNDSKATTPEAARLAIESFAPGCVHVILGGYDKQADLTPLAHLAAEHCRAVYTIGATGDAIAAQCEAAAGPARIIRCGTLDTAVREASQRAKPGDVVLLSPACASWDQFANYEHRGAAFLAAVQRRFS